MNAKNSDRMESMTDCRLNMFEYIHDLTISEKIKIKLTIRCGFFENFNGYNIRQEY